MAAVTRSSASSAKIVVVEADIFKDGHDIVAAALKWRRRRRNELARNGHETRSRTIAGVAIFSVYENATYEYTVEAWTDVFAGWQHEFAAKFEAGLAESNERNSGRRGAPLAAAAQARPRRRCETSARVRGKDAHGRTNAEVNRIAHAGELEVLMATYADAFRRHPVHAAAHAYRSIGSPRGPPPGTNSFPARPKAAATAARRSATACRGSMTPRRWASTSSIFRPSTRSA